MIKKLLPLSFCLLGFTSMQAQVTLYNEGFTSGATGWTLNVATGTNAASQPNEWQVNDSEGGVLPSGCGVAYNGNATLHITCTSLFCGSLITGAVYNASKTTNKRAESPAINTTGYSNLTLSFNFISLGDGVLDNASVWYNDGSGWQTLTASIKSSICGGGQGQWTAYSTALPSSCNNISNLQIGINWSNNGDNIGSDPSVAIDDIKVTATTPLSATTSQTNILCNGLCTGSATAIPSGGTSPYTYFWSTGGTGATINTLCAGTYTCTVTDAASASTMITVTITEPLAISLTAASSNNVSCFAGTNGAASINTPSGGTGALTIDWTPGTPSGDGTTSINGLSANMYTCTVTDANSCAATLNFNITEPSAPLALTSNSSNNVSCNGDANGTASVNNATGGTSSYTYDWTPGTPTGDGTTTISGLAPGSYTCTVTDANNCTAFVNFSITEPAAITNSINPTICSGESFTVGASSYTTAGTYTDVLTASNGCDSTVTTNLTVNMTSSHSINETACGSYTLNAQTYTSSGVYTQTLTNAVGCDSVITLTLTIDTPPVITTSTTGATITSNQNGATYQWLNCSTGLPIAGAGNQSFTASANGSYAVIVTNGSCSDTSNCVAINGIGILENSIGIVLDIYPNPTNGMIQVKSSSDIKTVSITDAQGRTILHETVNQSLFQSDLSKQPNGIYFIRINLDGHEISRKIVLNK